MSALPDTGSGITRDVGAIAIVEHDGSAYDAYEPDGTLNYPARARVARRFYETHGDNYDFLIVFTNFEFGTAEALAFHTAVRSQVEGIGKPIFDNGDLFGSPGRLHGYVDMAALSRYRRSPLSPSPGDPGFRASLNILAHEMAHEWLAEARYKNAQGQISSDLLGRDGAHWSALLDSDASVLYGSDWKPNGDGTFTAARVMDSYSSLDLYLMGLLPATSVGPMTLLRNPALDPAALPVDGETVTAVPETVTADQIIAAEGQRRPDALTSPKTFRLGFVFLTAPGTEPSAEDLEAVDRLRRAFAAHFFALTRGVAVADTDLVAEPVTSAAAPDLAQALSWLAAQQGIDGHWEDGPGTAVRDTAAALQAMEQAGGQHLSVLRGRTWIEAAPASNVDFESRRAGAAASPLQTSAARSALTASLLRAQNADGGFGLGSGYESDPMDTALALRALRALKSPPDTSVRRAVAALGALRGADGGWPAVAGDGLSTVVTAHVVLALQDWPEIPQAPPLVGAGLAALLGRRNDDGGFGESPSTGYATAIALQALMRSSAPAEVVEAGIGWLQRTQRPDGSWGGSPYQTALVLTTLKTGVAANLTVPADGLALTPVAPQEGEVVRVTARVQNVGRAGAAPTKARLYEGSVAPSGVVAEAAIPSLAAGESATVTLDLPTTDRAGMRVVYVVADPEGEVAESREDDNTTSRAVTVSGLLPDVAVDAAQIALDPYPPQEGETTTVSVVVRNAGAKPAPASVLRLIDGNPRLGGRLIGETTVPLLAAGESRPVGFSWTAAAPQGTHTLHAIADVTRLVTESDETNNEAAVPVAVTGPPPNEPDLEIAQVMVAPATLTRLPQAATVSVRVRNLGQGRAAANVVLYDGDPPAASILGTQAVDLPGRSGTTLSFPLTIDTPGTRRLVAVADPEGALAEASEANNTGVATLTDPRNTADLEVLSSEVTVAPASAVVGDPIEVTVKVHNRGTTAVAHVPVLLVHNAGSEAELVRGEVTVGGGETATVTLTWASALTGDPVPLAVKVDPFGTVPETDETNNRAAVSVRIMPSALPNLTVRGSDVAFSPDPPREGSATVVSALVRNAGVVASGPFAVRFHRGDPDAGGPVIGTATVDGLAAQASIVASVQWSPVDARGSQGIFVVVDSGAQVAEYDEADNRAFRPFGVLGLPDLVLTVGDVSLDPRFPRAGQPVTVHATVKNLGGQASPETVLRAVEGEGSAQVVIAELPLAAIAAGQRVSVDFEWTPAAPPGERTLSVRADPDGGVPEQDEGNNGARVSVVVQDADVYLTEAYFSPDGDGVQDRTILAYRATVPVDVIVSDSRGQAIRTLARRAPTSGSIEWDGRNDHGALAADGAYTFNLIGANGRALARATAILDLNRLSLHYASHSQPLVEQNLTCRVPDWNDIAWLPNGEEVLVMLGTTTAPGFTPGLVRLRPGGEFTYVSREPVFAGSVRFASRTPVSPDGQEVLVIDNRTGEIVAVGLFDGHVRTLASSGSGAIWSPDGRWIATDYALLARDGTVIREGFAGRVWSPDSAQLAQGNRIVDRETGAERVIDLPGQPPGLVFATQTEWRADGLLFLRVRDGSTGEEVTHGYLIDTATDSVRELPWLSNRLVGDLTWSADSTRALYFNHFGTGGGEGGDPGDYRVANEDGSTLFVLTDQGLDLSPGVSAALRWKDMRDDASSCLNRGRQFDLFLIRTAENLVVDLQPLRLPGNTGIVLKGTASDQNLDHYELDYAEEDQPGVWRPLSPSSDVPVVDDVLTVWAPARPGNYLVRLTARDRAGNVRTVIRVIAWDRAASIANITQTEKVLSPNGDGRKESVTFNYLVVEPSSVDVEISGPHSEVDEAPPAPVVRQLHLEYPAAGTASFDWDGRDESGQVVADGRYTVKVNGLPFPIAVDSTPPVLAWGYGDLRIEEIEYKKAKLPVVVTDRVWRVLDARLKRWQAGPYRGTDLEFVMDDSGAVGPRRDRKATLPETAAETEVFEFATAAGQMIEAEDHAGNRSSAPIFPVPARLFMLGATTKQLNGVSSGAIPVVVDPTRVYPLVPLFVRGIQVQQTVFRLAETLPGAAMVIFQEQPRDGVTWNDVAMFEANGTFGWGDLGRTPIPSGVRRGRFVARSGALEEVTPTFLFQLCGASLALGVQIPSPGSDQYVIDVSGALPERLASATLRVRGLDRTSFNTTVPLTVAPPSDSGLLLTGVLKAPSSCGSRLLFEVEAYGQSGRRYAPNTDSCMTLVQETTIDCLEQTFEYCSGTPDRLALMGSLRAVPPGSLLTFERGPATAPIVMGELRDLSGEVSLTPSNAPLDATGLAEGTYDVRARLGVGNDPARPVVAQLRMIVDRTPARLTTMSPADGAEACMDTQGMVDLHLAFEEAGKDLHLGEWEFRRGAGPWQPMCLDGPCLPGPARKAIAFDAHEAKLRWHVASLEAGDYTVRLKVCDRAGHETVVERRIVLVRDAPRLAWSEVTSDVFSPNGDGDLDSTTLFFEATRAINATVDVQGTDGTVIRRLVSELDFAAGRHALTWDGTGATTGAAAPDGGYLVTIAGRDSCGRTAQIQRPLVVDTRPPTALIARPVSGQTVGASVDVVGTARDDHFLRYELSVGPGLAPTEWTSLGVFQGAVGEGLLGHWNPPAVTEPYTLRLVATDKAHNRAAALAPVHIGPRKFIDRFAALPAIFSPNADGRLETTSIEYKLIAAARVTLDVLRGDGTVARTLESDVPHGSGAYLVSWDGLDGAGAALPDGDVTVRLKAIDPATSTEQQDAIAVILDRAPPSVVLDVPGAGAVVAPDQMVRGTVTDAHLQEYVVTAGGRELARGGQSAEAVEMGTLASLPDGPASIVVTAEDTAQNRATVTLPVVIDGRAPAVALHTPADASVLARSGTPSEVVGTVTDVNLAEYTLSVGPGAAPAYFDDVGRGTATVLGGPIGSWVTAGFLDGTYTLRLRATDRAGHASETQVAVTIDGINPTASITEPPEGQSLKAAVDVRAKATDANLKSWTLEAAGGPADTAFQWSPVASGESAVDGGVLGRWTLPPDGVHTLRLTVRDAAGHETITLRTVTVDTQPPSPPADLAAEVVRNGTPFADVSLHWASNTEPDLKGYRVRREASSLDAFGVEPAHREASRPDGVYRYTVVAEDRAGNLSDPARLTVKVDLAPPLARIEYPTAAVAVSGSVDVRGAAYSPDDFKEYRLFVGSGAAPSTWALLRQSTVKVPGGVLGTWPRSWTAPSCWLSRWRTSTATSRARPPRSPWIRARRRRRS